MPDARMRVGAVVLAVWAVVGATLVPLSSAAAVGPTHLCDGQTATIVGTNEKDDLSGTDLADVVWLGAGDDSYFNPSGNDTVCGGPGWDTVSVPASGQNIFGGRGRDQIYYNDEVELSDPLTIDVPNGTTSSASTLTTHHTGVEDFNGSENDDVFIGDDADNSFNGRGGFDRVHMGAGDDLAQIETGILHGGPGDDFVVARWGPIPRGAVTKIWGGGGADYLRGSPRHDVVRGGPGDDIIEGSEWSDTLYGDGGRDRIRGGTGIDHCSGERLRQCEGTIR